MPELSTVLLRRLHTVYLDQAGPRPGDPSTTEGLTALETEVLDRGYALTVPLRSALAWLGPTGLATAGAQLIRDIDILLGRTAPTCRCSAPSRPRCPTAPTRCGSTAS
ncbi:hypothetical protein ACFY0G_19885 [Streptomyces sp. NPDC001552]|uniref:hypothetical protein n=1 Tax=Streptomyces sp. NPDC001552 TaxID=3364587 RepID=UPI0036BF55AD